MISSPFLPQNAPKQSNMFLCGSERRYSPGDIAEMVEMGKGRVLQWEKGNPIVCSCLASGLLCLKYNAFNIQRFNLRLVTVYDHLLSGFIP